MSFSRWQKLTANSTAKVVACTCVSAYAVELWAGFNSRSVDTNVVGPVFSGKGSVGQAKSRAFGSPCLCRSLDQIAQKQPSMVADALAQRDLIGGQCRAPDVEGELPHVLESVLAVRDRQVRLKDHLALVELKQRIIRFGGFGVADIHAEPGKA